jgi:hypothetical protein
MPHAHTSKCGGCTNRDLATGEDEDLMASVIKRLGGEATFGAPKVEPVPSVFGADSSSFEDEDTEAEDEGHKGESVASESGDDVSKGCT